MLPSLDSVALVVELVDTRDLKSLGVRAVPVQVRPGAPSTLIENEIIWRVGRVAMQRIANPWTSVRLRDAPPYPDKKRRLWRLFLYLQSISYLPAQPYPSVLSVMSCEHIQRSSKKSLLRIYLLIK